jgi:guanylate kinase
MGEVTTIQITPQTRQELRDLGRKGETYNDLIQRLIHLAREIEFFKEIDRIIETEEFVSLDDI